MIECLKTKFGNDNNKQIVTKEGTKLRFYSYEIPIAEYDTVSNKLRLNKEWQYSMTTIFYFKQFINNYTSLEYKNKKQFEKLIETNKINVLN